jgi:hypothetical protein
MSDVTVEKIVNQALVSVGAQTISSFADGSNNATVASLFYDGARREVLAATQWGFARRVEAISRFNTYTAKIDNSQTPSVPLPPGPTTVDAVTMEDDTASGLPGVGDPTDIGGFLWDRGEDWTLGFAYFVSTGAVDSEKLTLHVHLNTVEYPDTGIALMKFFNPSLSSNDDQLIVFPGKDGNISFYKDGARIYHENLPDDAAREAVDIEVEIIITRGDIMVSVDGTEIWSYTGFGSPFTIPADFPGAYNILAISNEYTVGTPVWTHNFLSVSAFGEEVTQPTPIVYDNTEGTPDWIDEVADDNKDFDIDPRDMIKFMHSNDGTIIKRYRGYFSAEDGSTDTLITYIHDITDVTKWPSHFQRAVIAKLRALFAIPLGGRNARRTDWENLYDIELGRAMSLEGSEESQDQDTYGVATDSDPWVRKARY